jgi:hypothetical protein
MTPQEKAKAAVELLDEYSGQAIEGHHSWDVPVMINQIKFSKILEALELLRPLAAGTHVLVSNERLAELLKSHSAMFTAALEQE